MKQVFKYESPAYEIATEDGPGTDWCYLIGMELNGQQFTLTGVSFNRWEEYGADRLAAQLQAASVDAGAWHEGNAWDQYSTPQTYEEEKQDYYFSL